VHIAVVVPAFNIDRFLHRTLLSVLRQTHPDWSLVVVDDGSTDATAAVANGCTDSRIRLIRQENAGVSAARNRGVAAFLDGQAMAPVSGGMAADARVLPDAFVFLDGDDCLAPDAFAMLADTLESCPWAVAACGRYARMALNGATHPAPPPPDGNLLEPLLARNLFANGGQLLIRREAIVAVGEWRRDLSYGEDWEYWTRLALLGEFVAVPTPLPLLFVRERPGSAYLSRATDPTAYRPAMEAIFCNPAIADYLGSRRLADMWHRAEAEMAWSVGRELIRHGRQRDGRRWLGRSVWSAPSLRRMALVALSWSRSGPFRPYRTAA